MYDSRRKRVEKEYKKAAVKAAVLKNGLILVNGIRLVRYGGLP
ncbi:hypothetical protein [Fictibacillus sp. WQ 8-8]|nr:hypothetical protein [Fictibacillus sp. WQ 8-8]